MKEQILAEFKKKFPKLESLAVIGTSAGYMDKTTQVESFLESALSRVEEEAEQRGREDFASKVREAVTNTTTIEDFTARLFSITVHAMSRTPDTH